MRNSRLIWLLMFLGVVVLAPRANAWDGPGHMQVADIAWLHLAAIPAVKAVLKAILARARGKFTPHGPDDSSLRDAFDLAGTFPDFLKTAPAPDYEPFVAPMNLMFWPHHEPPQSARGEGVRCKSWHYYDTPINFPNGGTPPPPWTSNAIVAFAEAARRLKQLHTGSYDGPHFRGMNNDDLKFWWLGWILHLSGDAHQPLHTVSNFGVSGNEGRADAGGNLFLLAQGKKLHGLWDEMVQTAARKDGFDISDVESVGHPSQVLAQVSDVWDKAHVGIGDPNDLNFSHWIDEGAKRAQSIAYSGVTPGSAPSDIYMTRATNFAREAAGLAGRRLALVLTAVLG